MNEDDIEFRGGDNNPGSFSITEEGLGEIANWCRFQMELGRLSPSLSFDDDGELTPDFKISLLVWFILVEAYRNRGIEIPGIKPGAMFPEDWDV